MSKMTVIQLLNKIANGEEVPKYVRYINFVKNKEDIMMVCKENIIYKLDKLEIHLNDEVEIIEEDKKIENIKNLNTDYYDKNETYDYLGNKEIVLDILTLKHKINEIIDKINKD